MPLTKTEIIAQIQAKLDAALIDPEIQDRGYILNQLAALNQANPLVPDGSANAVDVAAGIDASADIESIKALISSLLSETTNSKAISSVLIQDSTPTARYFLLQNVIDQTTGLLTIVITNLDGTTPSPTPVLPIKPVSSPATLTANAGKRSGAESLAVLDAQIRNALATFSRPANTNPYSAGMVVAPTGGAGLIVVGSTSGGGTAGVSARVRRVFIRRTQSNGSIGTAHFYLMLHTQGLSSLADQAFFVPSIGLAESNSIQALIPISTIALPSSPYSFGDVSLDLPIISGGGVWNGQIYGTLIAAQPYTPASQETFYIQTYIQD
jgi:hypothetical protein